MITYTCFCLLFLHEVSVMFCFGGIFVLTRRTSLCVFSLSHDFLDILDIFLDI